MLGISTVFKGLMSLLFKLRLNHVGGIVAKLRYFFVGCNRREEFLMIVNTYDKSNFHFAMSDGLKTGMASLGDGNNLSR